jgi:hypothetical protein
MELNFLCYIRKGGIQTWIHASSSFPLAFDSWTRRPFNPCHLITSSYLETWCNCLKTWEC